MSDRSNGGWIAVVIAALMLPAVYMGAYYAMIAPDVPFIGPEPTYRIDSPVVDNALRPAHRVDRWMRPDRWKPYQLPVIVQ